MIIMILYTYTPIINEICGNLCKSVDLKSPFIVQICGNLCKSVDLKKSIIVQSIQSAFYWHNA